MCSVALAIEHIYQANLPKGNTMHNTAEQNEAFRKAFDATNVRWKAAVANDTKLSYILTLFANNGETATLNYDTRAEAVSMRQAFMNMGDYRDAVVTTKETK